MWRNVPALIALALACAETPSTPSPTPPPTLNAAPRPHAPPPNPAALVRPKQEIVVGGCARACRTSRQSLDTFLAATMLGDTAVARRHLDTSRLVSGAEQLGARWADAWLAGRMAERHTEITDWVAQWAAVSATFANPDDKTAAPAVEIERSDDAALVARWRVPDASGSSPRSLRLTLTKRGLEWLVSRVEPVR